MISLIMWSVLAHRKASAGRFCIDQITLGGLMKFTAPKRCRSTPGPMTLGRVTDGDGGGYDEARMRWAQKHMSRCDRRIKRGRRRPTHTRPSTRASRETTWPQELAPLHSERPDWDNRTRTGPAPGWQPLWSRSD